MCLAVSWSSFKCEACTIHYFHVNIKWCQGIELAATIPLLPKKEKKYCYVLYARYDLPV